MPNKFKNDKTGGWDNTTLSKRQYLFQKYAPAGGIYDPFQAIEWLKNHNTGEENQYYAAYFGLPNNVPGMTPGAQTEWDELIEQNKIDQGERISDFIGTTPRMDYNIQVLGDSLHLGQIYRNYDRFKQEHPNIPEKTTVKKMYKLSKQIMDNPNKWQQAEDFSFQSNSDYNTTGEYNPLGMLSKFGIKWDPKEKALFVHDTYDFPEWTYKMGLMLRRPQELKIRGKIGFDPKKGSKMLRNNLKGFYTTPKGIYE